jgi:hypothetical protein
VDGGRGWWGGHGGEAELEEGTVETGAEQRGGRSMRRKNTGVTRPVTGWGGGGSFCEGEGLVSKGDPAVARS